MSDYELTIERAFDTNALSLFNCGVREIDQLIHKKTGGLSSFVSEVPCEFYVAKISGHLQYHCLFCVVGT